MSEYIEGSKGPKKPKPPRKDPDTLKSITTIKVQDLLSEGEIEGFATPNKYGQSVFLDDVALIGSDGIYNSSPGSTLQFARGLESPLTVMPGFATSSSVISTSSNVIEPVQETSTIESRYDSATVVVQLDALYKQHGNGDLTGYNISFLIEAITLDRVTSHEVITRDIVGKTMSKYHESFEVKQPTAGKDWFISVTRLSALETSNEVVNDIRIASLTGEISVDEKYPNTAMVGFSYEASQQGQNIPTRSYDIKGVKVQVPTNWVPADPDRDAWGYYDGDWDGQFRTEWSDDPSWVLYDLVTNQRYGLGMDPTLVDVYSFYIASRYNSELVSYQEIEGGPTLWEPRFRFNGIIQKRENGMKMLQAIASVCRAVLYTASGGIIRMLQDSPTTPSKLMTHANVLGGEFTYEGTEYLSRITSCSVTYSAEEDRFLPVTITEKTDQASINKYGLNTNDVTGYGVTSGTQARRLARWILDTSLNQTQVVKFSVGWNNALLEPGEVVEIYDRTIQVLEGSGLVAAGSTDTSIELDREVIVDSALYTLQIQGDDGQYEERAVNSISGKTITVNTPFTFTPSPGRLWGLSNESNQQTQQFKIQQITESSPGTYEILGIEYDPGKYERLESGLIRELPIYGEIGGFEVPQVKNLEVNEESFLDQNGVARVRLRVTWDQADFDIDTPDERLLGYVVKWRKNGNNYNTSELLQQSEFIMDDALPGTDNPGLQLPPGVYDFEVTAYNMRSVGSQPLRVSKTMAKEGGSTELAGPTNLKLKAGTGTGTEFITKDLQVEWTAPSSLFNRKVILESYQVDIYDASGTDTLLRTVYVRDGATHYDYPYELNVLDGGPHRNIRIDVSTRDSLQQVSSPISLLFTNPSPAIQNFTLTPGLGQVWIDFLDQPESDQVGYVIGRGDNANFVLDNNSVYWRGNSSFVSLEAEIDVEYWYKVAAYDLYDSNASSLTSSNAVNGTSTGIPDVPEFEETSIQMQDVIFVPANPNNTLTWTSGTAARTIGSSVTSKTTPAGSYTWSSGNIYIYYDYEANTINATSSLNTAVIEGRIILGNYRGGSNWTSANGDAYMDGGRIIAQTIGATQITSGSIIADKLAANSVIAGKIATDAVTANTIEAGAIIAGKIATDAVTANTIQTNAVTADSIAANSVNTSELVSGSVTADIVTSGELITSSAQIKDAIIGSAEIANLAVTSGKIANLAVDTLKIKDRAVTFPDAKIANARVTSANPDRSSTPVVKNVTTKIFKASGGGVPVLIQWSMSVVPSEMRKRRTFARKDTPATYYYYTFNPVIQIWRDDTLLRSFSASGVVAGAYYDYPTAGSHSYTVKFVVAGQRGTNRLTTKLASVSNVYVLFLEAKK